MYQSNFSPHTMVQLIGNYQPNGQFFSLPNHAFYADSPINVHQDIIQFNRTNSNHNTSRQCVTQQNTYPLELLQRIHLESQNSHAYNVHTPATTPTWSQRLSSPRRASDSQQRVSLQNGSLSLIPMQSQINYRPVSSGSSKKPNWNNNGTKLNKRHSYHDLPLLKDNCNQSDSGFSSRSPTPNRHYKSGSHNDSSDERDSVSSVSEGKYNRNKNSRNNYRTNMVSSISIGNLFQESSEPLEIVQKTNLQNLQNRRKYPTVRMSPTVQRPERVKKFVGPRVNQFNFPPKYYYNPVDRFLEKSHLIQSKHRPATLLNGSEYDKLSLLIWKKFEENQLTQDTFCHKMYLWRYLFYYIKQRFPHYGLFMVGSTLNGFGSNVSDVDMCLLVKEHTTVDPRAEAIYRLGQVMSALRRSDFISHSELIQAKVPILKIRDKVYNLDVDLNYNNVVGIRNTHLLHCYSQIDWRVRPLVLIVKMWAQSQNINEARHMTISSYSLVLMVIHFLQCGVTPAVLPCLHDLFKHKFHPFSDIHSIDIHEQLSLPIDALQPRNMLTLGELLIEFFKYYDTFDYDKYAISVRVAGKLPIESCRYVRAYKNDPHQWKYLCVEEPFDFTNTARSVYDPSVFQMIKEIFKQTFIRLSETKDLSTIFSKLKIK